LGAAARARALRCFDEATVVDLVLHTYREVASRKSLDLGAL
jgi:hypothetical protein